MYQLNKKIKATFILVILLALLVACGTNTPAPVETTDLTINLEVHNWDDASVEKAAVIINDATGSVLDYRVLDSPSEEVHSMTFSNMPANATVTIFSKSTRHLTWPTDDVYSTILFKTYDLSMVQSVEGKIFTNPGWTYLDWNNPDINTRSLSLRAACTQDASYLGTRWYNPETGYTWGDSLECVGGEAEGLLWSPIEQDDGKISTIVWSQVESWPYEAGDYTQPFQYLRIIDHDPDSQFEALNTRAYSGAVTTADITITNLPSDTWVYYFLTGIRKGVPIAGLQAYADWGNPTSTATLADISDELDAVIQTAQVHKYFRDSTNNYVAANYRLYKFLMTNNLSPNTTWDYNEFPTAPNPNRVKLQQTDHLALRAEDFGMGNKSVILGIYTAATQPRPIYIRWLAYTSEDPGVSTVEYNYPKLPSELNGYAPNLNLDYVSANISARSYDLLTSHFTTQGTRRYVWVKIRDNITDQSVAGASSYVPASLGPDTKDTSSVGTPFGDFLP